MLNLVGVRVEKVDNKTQYLLALSSPTIPGAFYNVGIDLQTAKRILSIINTELELVGDTIENHDEQCDHESDSSSELEDLGELGDFGR